MAAGDANVEQYLAFLNKWREGKPVRQYDHPIAIIGGGMGGITLACEMQRRGRENYTLFERDSRWGGATWNDVANRTTKLQTEKGSYHPLFIDMRNPVDPELKTWPARDSLLLTMHRVVEEQGVAKHARLETNVAEVARKGDPLSGGSYLLKIQDNDGDLTDFPASAVLACPGVFYLPKDIKFPGRNDFGGYITHGSYNELNLSKLKDATILIVGHGGFTIENVRTCVENKAKMVKIICRHRHFSGPKMVSWLVSSQEFPVPGNILLKGFQVMYDLIGFDVWSHPGVQTDKNRSMAFISQETTFGVTDIYFLAFAYGLVEVYVDEVEKLSHHCAHTKKGEQIECQVIMKCLGSDCDPDMDEVYGLTELKGYWVNGEPLCALMTMAHGVQAKNYGSFSVGPFFAGACTTLLYFLDYPEELLPMLPNIPGHKASAEGPAYSVKGSYMLACGVIISQNPDLSWQLQAMDRLKAAKTLQGHPKEKHLAECMREWELYIQMFKDNGQIPADAKHVPYPYTSEIMDELVADSLKYWTDLNAKRK